MSEFDPNDDGFDRDADGNVVNGEGTYRELGLKLFYDNPPPVLPWSDEQGVVLDLLLVYGADELGRLSGGQDGFTGLMVCTLNSARSFCFQLQDETGQRLVKSPDYVGEKLGLGGYNPTTTRLAELVNGVAQELLS